MRHTIKEALNLRKPYWLYVNSVRTHARGKFYKKIGGWESGNTPEEVVLLFNANKLLSILSLIRIYCYTLHLKTIYM